MYGAVLRRARTERGLTQLELSAIAGIEQPNISAIENDRRMPSAETLHRLLLACGFELVAAAGPRVVPIPAPEDRVDGRAADVEGTGVDLPTAVRVRMLTAALDAAEAIVRHR
jgi:transcriptional regulator with XRE-family HTH domain